MTLPSHYREVGTETKSVIGLKFFFWNIKRDSHRELLSHKTQQLERKEKDDKSNLKGEKYIFKDIEANKLNSLKLYYDCTKGLICFLI